MQFKCPNMYAFKQQIQAEILCTMRIYFLQMMYTDIKLPLKWKKCTHLQQVKNFNNTMITITKISKKFFIKILLHIN